MPAISSLVVALTPSERSGFLPEPFFSEVCSLGATCKVIDPSQLSAAEFARELAEANPDVLVNGWSTKPLPAVLPPRLRYVCYLTGSIKHFVAREHLEQGLLVTNWADSISRTVAECALYHVLSSLRLSPQWTLSLHREDGWRAGYEKVGSLFKRRVGIHGFGPVAREFIKLIQPFDCTLSVYAPDFNPAAIEPARATSASSLESLFAENDVIVEVAPLIPATRGLVTEKILRLIRPGGVFVNVGRGAVVDEAALVRVAREGKIYIGLDVFAEEPLPLDSGFRGLANVNLTPHIAGPTNDRFPDAGERALNNLRAYAADLPLDRPITPEIYDHSS